MRTAGRWIRQPSVQGLRAVAVAAVVAFHAGLPLHGGFTGVDAFFVISGWALAGTLAAEAAATGRIRLADYAARRARRIVPLLALVVAVVLVAHVATSNPFVPVQVVPHTALAGLASLANVYLYRHTGYFDSQSDAGNPLLHLWSLSVEEQLYVVVPMLLLVGLAIRRRGRWWGPTIVVAVVGAASVAFAGATSAGALDSLVEAPARFAFYAPLTRLWEVAAGALVALTHASPPGASRFRSRPADAVAVGGALLLAAGLIATNAVGGFPVPGALPVVIGTAVLLAAAPSSRVAGAVLGSAPLRWLGDRSYGWYLWHWPAAVVAARLVPGSRAVRVGAMLASLALASLTFRLVEQPFRLDPRFVGRRALAMTVALLAVPAAFAVIAATGSRHGWGLHEPPGWSDAATGINTGCVIVNRDLPDDWPEHRCRTGDAAAPTILVLGDIHVASVIPGIEEVATARGMGTAEWSRFGCPFLTKPTDAYPRCAGWQRAALDLVDRLDPAVVVVANRAPAYVDGDAPVGPAEVANAIEGTGTRLERWEAGLDGVLAELDARGVPAVVVGPVPDYGTDFPRDRLWPVARQPPTPTLDSDEVVAGFADVVAVERRVAAAHGDGYVDPIPVLCADTCRPEQAGTWVQLDAHQLTRAGSSLLVGDLGAAIDRLTGPS